MVAISEKNQIDDIPDQEVTEKLFEKHDSSEYAQVSPPYKLLFSKRLLILILLFCGYLLAAVIRVCMNIAIIEMTSNKTSSNNGNETTQKVPEFNWNSITIGLVLGSHSFGFAFSAFGGYLAVKFGGSVTYGLGIASVSLLTILNPVFLNINFYAFLAIRIIAGAFDGCAYACSAEVFSRWIPLNERSTFMAIIFGGLYIGIAVAYPICGYIALYWGWRMIFYVTGGSAFTWSIIWLLIARNQPSKDRRISRKELEYILSRTETTPRKEIVHPYKKIFLSSAIFALGVAKFTYGWGYSVIITSLPLYVKDMTNREINEIGIISSLPNLCCIFMTPIIGALIDYLQNTHNLKPTEIHKSMMSFGFITGFILFGVASFSRNFVLSMTCFILIKIFLSFNFLILQLTCLYMAPKHSSLLLGLSAVWFFASQVSSPALIGFIVVSHDLQEWNTCFMISAGVLIFGAIFYMIYGTSELQPWATTTSSSHDSKHETALQKNNNNCYKK